MFYLFIIIIIISIIVEVLLAKRKARIKSLILPVLFTLILIFVNLGTIAPFVLVAVILFWIIALALLFEFRFRKN